jgi:hypothetical protein
MLYNILKNMLYMNLLINQEQDLLMKMFDGLLQYLQYGSNRLNNLCEKLLIKFVLNEWWNKVNLCFSRLVLLQGNFLNNYWLLWNQKQHQYIFVNFECISLFLMILLHILVIQYVVNMVHYRLHCPINHHQFFSILINVSIRR